MTTLKGMIYTKDCEFLPGMITIKDGLIQDVRVFELEELTTQEQEKYLIPGLVDVHFHGAAGYDFCDGTVEACRAIEEYENKHGITSICPATMSLSLKQLEDIVKNVTAWKREEEIKRKNTENHNECRTESQSLRGIHLEGPFISKEKKGAQKEEYIIPVDKEWLRNLQTQADGLIKIVSLAPEMDGAIDCIEDLKDEITFSVGHTMADYQTACQAFESGARHVTHLYNGMKTATHREPSVLGAALDYKKVDVELICDGVHVHPSVVRNTFRMFGDNSIVLISDSIRATGMEDRECVLDGKKKQVENVYMLGGQNVKVEGDRATLSDGTIAGSVRNLFDCMKIAISMGISKESAIKAATVNPARSIGIDDAVGSLETGKRADILILDQHFNLQSVIMAGKTLEE